MRYKLLVMVFLVVLLSGCESFLQQKAKYGEVFPNNEIVVNDIFLIEGKPAVRYNKVTIFEGQKLVFLGQDEFEIKFEIGSFFDGGVYSIENSSKSTQEKNRKDRVTETYKSKDGVIVLDATKEATRGIKKGEEFKYSIFVNGVELDPIAGFGGGDHTRK